jgi:hypothetical protein
MKTKILFASGLAALQIFTFSSATLVAQAAGPCITETGVECPKDFGKDASPTIIVDLVNKVANWMFTFLLIIAVVYIILAAFNYLTSEGNEEKVTAAHKALVYAAVAIAVAVLSRGFVYIIRNVVEGKDVSTQSSQQAQANQNSSTNPDDDTDNNAPVFSSFNSLSLFSKFAVRIQVCKDQKIPGVYLQDEDGLKWSNFPKETGNPDIGPDQKIGTKNAQPNAGEYTTVGNVNTGLLGNNVLGLGTTYTFEVEICNDGATPALMYNLGNDTKSWKYL